MQQHKIKLSRLMLVVLLLVLVCGGGSLDVCDRSDSLTKYTTLCDSPYCNCDANYKVTCSCVSYDGLQPATNLTLRSNGTCVIPNEASGLQIRNCPEVLVTGNSLKGLNHLKTVDMSNIKYLNIQSYGFSWNETTRLEHQLHGIKFNFTDVTIPDVPSYTFKGLVEQITFHNAYIGMVRAFAFTSTSSINRITLRKTNVANAEPQSFKKIQVNKFVVDESRFFVIPSRFINEVTVEEFSVERSFINVIRTLAVRINNVKLLTFVSNRINHVESQSLDIVMKGDVLFKSNALETIMDEAFVGISVNKRWLEQHGKQKFVFNNNTVANFRDNSFKFERDSFQGYFDKLLIDEECSCESLDEWKVLLDETDLDEQLKPWWCHPEDTKEINYVYIQGRLYYEDHCVRESSRLFFFILATVLTCIGVLVLAICVICLIKQSKKFHKLPTSEEQAKKNEIIRPQQANHNGLILPEGRTYKETEFHVVVEKTEPLVVEPVTTVGKPPSSVLNSDL